MLCSLENKVIAITGGFGYLGSQVGRLAAAEGAKVALIGRRPSTEGLGGDNVLTLSGVDLTDPNATSGAMAAIVNRFGKLDALVNAAGAFRFERLDSGDPATWDQMYQQNLKTTVMSCKAALGHLSSPGGRIVNVVGAAARNPATTYMMGGTANAALINFTKALADLGARRRPGLASRPREGA